MTKNYDQEISILSAGVKFEGKLSSEGNLRIDGEFDGELITKGNLTLGDKSKVKGMVRANNITCGGEIVGTVEASEKLILESLANVDGDISAKILIINEGAKFKGKSNMNNVAENDVDTDG